MEYRLKDHAYFLQYAGVKSGIAIRCPNCGATMSAYFRNAIGHPDDVFSRAFPKRNYWSRTGESLPLLTLFPTFQAHGHYEAEIQEGTLKILTEFHCTKG